MIWLIGCKGMLGSEVAKQLDEKKLPWVGTDSEVDITDPQALVDFTNKIETAAPNAASSRIKNIGTRRFLRSRSVSAGAMKPQIHHNAPGRVMHRESSSMIFSRVIKGSIRVK